MSNASHKVERFQSTMGDSWWWRRVADLVDRRSEDGVEKFDYQKAIGEYVTRWQRYRTKRHTELGIQPQPPVYVKIHGAEKPEMLPRPEGMSRQMHRRLYRETCKLAGVPWRSERLFKTPRRERGRNWKDLSPEELEKLNEQWAEFTKASLKVE